MSATLDSSRHRVLLVGPRVVLLQGFFEKRGYSLCTAANGVEGMAQLDTDPCELVVLELDLGDLTATEFLMAARQGSPRSTFLLVDEPARAGQIVKALQAGLDGFLAAPVDEDRLFYEVDRHLRRVGQPAGDDVDPSGFEEHSTQTQMTTLEGTRAGIELRDTRAQLEQASEALANLAAENERLTADVRRFDAVQDALAGQLEGHLDVEEATRLRERLGLAQVAEIEMLTLRSDVVSLKAARREQDQRIEELQRDLREARAAVPPHGFAEPPPTEVGHVGELEERVGELEGQVARWEQRSRELEATLTAARQALSLAEEETEAAVVEARAEARVAAQGALDAALDEKAALDDQQVLLRAEIDRLTGMVVHAEAAAAAATSQATGERAEGERLRAALLAAEAAAATALARAVEDDVRQRAASEEAITLAIAVEREASARQKAQAVKDAVAAERARLEREQTSALEVAMSAASHAAHEKHRAALQQAIERERERSVERERTAVAAAVAEARAQSGAIAETRATERIAAALDEARAFRERADDVELQLEEARTRIEFLEMDAARVVREADERVAAVEAAFKKEKLRLIEEKQTAASGSQEAILRMDALREEAQVARRQAQASAVVCAEAEAAREAADAQAQQWREALDHEAERAAVALDGVARLEAELGALQTHARVLGDREATAVDTAERAEARAAAALEAASAAAAQVEERVAAIVEVLRADLADRTAELEARMAAAERRAVASEEGRITAETQAAATQSTLEARIGSLDEQVRVAEAAVAAARREATDALELERTRAADAAAAAEAAAVAADVVAATAKREAADALQTERARAATESAAAIDAIRDDIAQLEEELLDVRARAAVDASDAEARIKALEALLVERDRALLAATSAAASAVEAGDTVRTLEGRLAELEHALSSSKSAEASTSAMLANERAIWDAERERMEAALSSSAAGATALAQQARALEDMQTSLSAEIEARAAAERLALGLRTEAHAVHAQASRAVAELRERLAVADDERTALLAEQASLQGLLTAAQGVDGRTVAEVAGLRQRIVQLEEQLVDPAMLATVRSLVDAVEPLRWGLGSAIDYLSPFEGNDVALAGHVRNMRLLSATLARLVGEASARPGSG